MIRIIKTAWTLTLAIGAATLPAAAAPKDQPEWYLRQETWQETMRVSREALVRHRSRPGSGRRDPRLSRECPALPASCFPAPPI